MNKRFKVTIELTALSQVDADAWATRLLAKEPRPNCPCIHGGKIAPNPTCATCNGTGVGPSEYAPKLVPAVAYR